MWSWRALFAVVITAAVLSVPLYIYWGFLTKGIRPPESTQILNRMEKEGVPEFTLNDLQGHSISLSQFKGKVVLVNIWATWCAPCVKEFPSMKTLVENFKGEVVVLAVSHDRNLDDIESFIKAFGSLPADFHILWDQDKVVGKIFGTDVLPETYILSRELKIVRKVAGDTNYSSPGALEFFRELLKAK